MSANVIVDNPPGLTMKQVPFLHLLLMHHDVGAIKAMLEYGAEVNKQDSDGNNELMRLVITGHPCLHGRDCKTKNVMEIAKILLKAGSSMNIKNNEGHTALSLVNKGLHCASFKRPFMEYMSQTRK